MKREQAVALRGQRVAGRARRAGVVPLGRAKPRPGPCAQGSSTRAAAVAVALPHARVGEKASQCAAVRVKEAISTVGSSASMNDCTARA